MTVFSNCTITTIFSQGQLQVPSVLTVYFLSMAKMDHENTNFLHTVTVLVRRGQCSSNIIIHPLVMGE